MATDRGPRLKKSRRAGEPLGLVGYRDEATKCKIDVPPGQHGTKKGRISNYGTMLKEKQKLRRIYGVLERQFRRFFAKASRMKGSTGENLLQLLECRLDNVVYRMGFASTRREGRQMVSHRSILVNGVVVNIPSYIVKPGDVVEVREKSKKQLRIQAATEVAQQRTMPDWLKVDFKKLLGEFTHMPQEDEIPIKVDLNKIIEFYSR